MLRRAIGWLVPVLSISCILSCSTPAEKPAAVSTDDADTAEDNDSGPAPVDADGDGFGSIETGGTDCDDTDPGVHPDAEEVPYDGVDNNCLGGDIEDVDLDGFAAVEAGGEDCDDTNPEVHPGADEINFNGVDEDCDERDCVDAQEWGPADDYGDPDLSMVTDCGCDDSWFLGVRPVSRSSVVEVQVLQPVGLGQLAQVELARGGHEATWTGDLPELGPDCAGRDANHLVALVTTGEGEHAVVPHSGVGPGWSGVSLSYGGGPGVSVAYPITTEIDEMIVYVYDPVARSVLVTVALAPSGAHWEGSFSRDSYPPEHEEHPLLLAAAAFLDGELVAAGIQHAFYLDAY